VKIPNEPTRTFLKILRPDALSRDLRDFLLDVQAANRTPGTVAFYRQKLTPFLDYLRERGIVQAQDIAPSHLRAYLAVLNASHSAGGVHAHWRAVRAFLRFLVREGILDSNPLDKVRAPKVDVEPLAPVNLEHLKAMLATCDRGEAGLRDRAILLTLLDTGLRAGEATALNVHDLDLNDGALMVRRSKSRRPRTVFVGRQARRALSAYLRARGNPQPDEPLFATVERRGRLTYAGLRDVVRRRARLANVPAPSLHSFRRAFALTMLRNGADVVSLSRMMGHGSLPVLMRYLRQEKQDLGRVHERHSPVDNWL
jgi:site-specific recombinase XerD